MLSIAAATAAPGAGMCQSASQATSQATPQPRLVHAAHEFEAQMMQELLKPMTSGNGLDGEDSGSASGSGGALGEFASEALGRALSERGGFGIANGIIRELSHSGSKPIATQVTGNSHGNTVMNSFK
jgi:Rod binding domain-containing protein